jgi:micrococcal nuclease
MSKNPYTYNASVVRVIDGDTVIMDVDLGFGLWIRGQSFRLLGINAREHDVPGGLEAAANLATLLPAGRVVTITSVKPDKYGSRYDVQIDLMAGQDLSTLLIQTGWAAAWNGQGQKPVPLWPRPTPSATTR